MANAAPIDRAQLEPLANPERRHRMIAEAAYFRAERRGFEAGHELDDWLAAEAEIDPRPSRADVPIDPYLPRYLVA